jgi:general secretion pathway protein E
VVSEVHVVDDVLRDRVTEGAPMSAIRGHAEGQGIEPLARIGARCVSEGRSTVEEIKRVVGFN